MVIWTRSATAIAAVILLGGVAVHASDSPSRTQGVAAAKRLTKELIVTSAAVDRESETVTLRGFNFGDLKPYVYCETHLMTVLSATDEEIVVAFPASAIADGTYLFTVIRNSPAPSRAAFYVTTNAARASEGREGPAGPQGPAGPAGADGLPGPQGPEGPQGPAGPAGATGATGETGATGATGATGPQGPQGSQGPQGPQGPQGFMGPAGPAGSNGVSGFERAVGDSGPILMDSGASWWVSATCPAGKRAVAGGYELLSQAVNLTVTVSAPLEADPATWRVAVRNNTAVSLTRVQVKSYALCALMQ